VEEDFHCFVFGKACAKHLSLFHWRIGALISVPREVRLFVARTIYLGIDMPMASINSTRFVLNISIQIFLGYFFAYREILIMYRI
jgi:hypothetical protein